MCLAGQLPLYFIEESTEKHQAPPGVGLRKIHRHNSLLMDDPKSDSLDTGFQLELPAHERREGCTDALRVSYHLYSPPMHP